MCSSDLGLFFGGVLYFGGGHLRGHADSAGIHEHVAFGTVRHHHVARHSGTIVHDGHALADQPVEQTTFSDVGTADDGDAGIQKEKRRPTEKLAGCLSGSSFDPDEVDEALHAVGRLDQPFVGG